MNLKSIYTGNGLNSGDLVLISNGIGKMKFSGYGQLSGRKILWISSHLVNIFPSEQPGLDPIRALACFLTLKTEKNKTIIDRFPFSVFVYPTLGAFAMVQSSLVFQPLVINGKVDFSNSYVEFRQANSPVKQAPFGFPIQVAYV